MSLSQVSPRSRVRSRFGAGALAGVTGALCIWILGEATLAHEHKHTHQNLARAAARVADSEALQTGLLGGLTRQQIEDELAQGVIDEDECLEHDSTGSPRDWGRATNWNSHFYEAKAGVRLGVNVLLGGSGCEHIRFGEHTNAAERANMLYGIAVEEYRSGRIRSSFRVLGRVLHLLQDMTSPAHVHDDPHGEAPFLSDCGGDSDDFERWGYCEGLAAEGRHARICEYFYDQAHTNHPNHDRIDFGGCSPPPIAECLADFDSDGQATSYGVPPAGFHCRLWAALHSLYAGRAQGNRGSDHPVNIPAGRNFGYAFVHHLANVTYDFTTFTVHLQDVSVFNDVQPDSELKRMLRGSTQGDCNNSPANDVGLCEATDANGWRIRGDFQNIGHTNAQEGSTERAWPDVGEEWWLMPTHYFRGVDGFDVFIDGFAYIENSGGEGPAGTADVDSFIPLRYGCTAAESAANGRLCSENGVGVRSKAMYQQLYGTVANREDPFVPEPHRGKSMLRIYGDVLYTSAVAYGAGLIEAFVEEVTVPPIADPGGPYQGEACTPITLDARDSSDPNGTIVSYAWDFTNDGTLDVVSADPLHSYAYPSVFDGLVRLRVTDNDGFSDEATTGVTITPDVTPPAIQTVTATPNRLWPPNHAMRSVSIGVSVADACGQASCRIIGVTSNEPENRRGKARAEPDWVIVDDLTVQLRAERSGNTAQRVYTIALECVDAAGNRSVGSVMVAVPHDQGAR